MKKLVVLLLIAAAFIAAPVFAETTHAVSGEFEFQAATDFEDYSDTSYGDLCLDLTAVTGDFTSFSLGIEAEDTDSTDAWTVNEATMTMDFASLVGENMVLNFTLGFQDYEASAYQQFTEFDGYGDFSETSDANSLTVSFGTDTIYTSVWISPEELVNDDAEFATELFYVSDALQGSVHWTKNADDDKGNIGASAYYGADAFAVAAVVEDDLDAEVYAFGVNAETYAVENFVPGIAYACTDTDDIAVTSSVAVSLVYTVSDFVGLFGSYNVSNFDDVEQGYNAGVQLTVDTVEFDLAANYGNNTMNSYDADEAFDDFYVSLYVDASF